MSDFRFTSQIPNNARAFIDFYHDGKENSTTAFECGERCGIKLRLSRSVSPLSCEIVFFNEYLSLSGRAYSGAWIGMESGMDSFFFDVSDITENPALFFFYIKVKTPSGAIYIKRYGDAYITISEKICDLFQITVSKFEYSLPKKLMGGVIYHIFVDRFNRGGTVPVSDGAKLISGAWKNIPEYPEYPGAPLKNNTFYGGTLYGIIDKLDYIKSLGVNAIYLSPVFSAASNHKYDTADYMSVDKMFGGDAALKALIDEAASRGILIILDGVFNHTGDDSIYFNRYSRYDSIGAYNSQKSPYYSWYDFKDHPNNYTSWWGIQILPRINPDNPDCGEFFTGDGGVIDKYRKMGVYGFRLDVADELSDKFIAKIKSRLSIDGESMLYGEVWEDASTKMSYGVRKKYYRGDELDGVMNYPLRVGLIDYFLNSDTGKIGYALKEIINNAPPRIRNLQMNLIGSHDTYRALTALSGISSEGKTNFEICRMRLSPSDYAVAKARLMAAYTVLATLPGVPSVFYGDEAGLEGYGDPFCRMPYPWGKEDTEIINHYKTLGKIRAENEVYKDGEYELLYLSKEILVFARYNSSAAYITVINNSKKKITAAFDSVTSNLMTGKRAKRTTLAPMGSAVFKMNTDTAFEIISEENS